MTVLSDFSPPSVRFEVLLSMVVDYFQSDIPALIGPSRKQSAALPRQVLMYLARQNTRMSLAEIGERLGGRDHTSVIHGVQKITRLLDSDQQLRSWVDELQKKLLHGQVNEAKADVPVPAAAVGDDP